MLKEEKVSSKKWIGTATFYSLRGHNKDTEQIIEISTNGFAPDMEKDIETLFQLTGVVSVYLDIETRTTVEIIK